MSGNAFECAGDNTRAREAVRSPEPTLGDTQLLSDKPPSNLIYSASHGAVSLPKVLLTQVILWYCLSIFNYFIIFIGLFQTSFLRKKNQNLQPFRLFLVSHHQMKFVPHTSAITTANFPNTVSDIFTTIVITVDKEFWLLLLLLFIYVSLSESLYST